MCSAYIELKSSANVWCVFQTESNPIPNDSLTYVDYQTSMVRLAKQIARTAQDMVRSFSTVLIEYTQYC